MVDGVNAICAMGDCLLSRRVKGVTEQPDGKILAQGGSDIAAGSEQFSGGRVQAVCGCLSDYEYPDGVSHCASSKCGNCLEDNGPVPP